MVKIGDRVGYSAHFLHSTQADLWTSERRGEVKAVEGNFATILWDDLHSLKRAHVSNIARVGSLAFGDPHYKPKA